MDPSTPYHFAYIVADLQEAMPRYEETLGVLFREPMKRELFEGLGSDFRTPAKQSFEVVFTYSIAAAPPYVELIQAGSGPIFGAPQGEAFHHMGVWVPDPAAAQAAQLAAGARCEGRFFSAGELERVWFASASGVRAEFVNEAVRPETEQWLAGGHHWRA